MASRESPTRCLAIVGSGLVVAAIFTAGLILGFTLVFSSADKTTQAPSSGEDPLLIAAVGDGFISGEGAGAFFPGTDRPGQNQCRRTGRSFPYLAARAIEPPAGHDGIALTSAACSGAATRHVVPFRGVECVEAVFPDGCPQPQYERRADGARDPAFQVDRVHPDTDVVLAMVGAEDANLIDAIALCAAEGDPCPEVLRPWVASFGDTLRPRLDATLSALRRRAPSAMVLAATYPDLFFRETCGRIRMEQEEVAFLSEEFIPQLNAQILAAAEATGAEVIDLEEAFAGHRLCQPRRPDGSDPQAAVNSFQIRPIRGLTSKPSSWFHGSFHPTEFGHELLAVVVAERLAAAPHDGARPSLRDVELPDEFLAGPIDEYRYRNSSPCGNITVVATLTMARPAGSEFAVTADPATAVCHRAFSDRWSLLEAADGATALVVTGSADKGLGAWHEVLYRRDGDWIRVVMVAPDDPGTAHLPLAKAWLWSWVVVVGGIVAHPVIYVTLLAFLLAGAVMWCTRRTRPPAEDERPLRTRLRAPGR